ncbi:MAG: D-tyrosyl-tRNA(Tyr) deacylase [Kiritimatiellae bacterium]|nr:D-tyrosyl-tRNA(Tyr) deacylase [Kiritimatiellia bacterium]MBR4945907.1 D-tyrosyl-tRNA(Tyr) deacylase [Kiritimatiellia bacterium]
MRFLVQRVTEASVQVAGETISAFQGTGFLVLCGVAPTDTQAQAEKLCAKLLKLRVFEDEHGAMNRSLMDVQGSVILVSQFTLYADTASGNRPGFSTAARPEVAEPLYDFCCATLRATLGDRLGTGRFGADMAIRLVNDGPCTFLLEA